MRIRIKELGYTLVGMSVALTVAGLIVAFAASGLRIYFYDRYIDITRDNVAAVKLAIEEFVRVNGYYPCPAPLNVEDDNSNYGIPIKITKGTEIEAVSICERLSVDKTDYTIGTNKIEDVYRVFVENEGNVVRGAVPFRLLNIPKKYSIDAYGMRIEYAVTVNIANKSTYSNDGGLIDVVGRNNQSILPVAAKAHFVVFSHGGDKVGGFNDASGIQTIPCNIVAADRLDSLNCGVADVDATATYRLMSMADLGITDTDHYDDYLLTAMSPDLPFWIEAINNTDNIFFDTSLTPNIAIGYAVDENLDDGELNATVSVKGETRASGNIYAQYICDASATNFYSNPAMNNCVKIDDLGGTGIICPTDEYVSSITFDGNGLKLNCQELAAGTNDIRCPAGQVMTGISQAGGIVCGYLTASFCPTKYIPMCNNNVKEITGKIHGSRVPVPSEYYDSDYQETYDCINGEWVLFHKSGKCDIDAIEAGIQSICNTSTFTNEYQYFAINDEDAPKSGYSGLWDVKKSEICEDDYIEIKDDNITNCVSGAKKIEHSICSVTQAGYIEKSYEWKCDAGIGAWEEIVGSEVDNCLDIIIDKDSDCPSGYLVYADDANKCILETANQITYCPSGYSLDVDGNCTVCNNGATQTRTRIAPCGLLTEIRDYDCSNNRWSAWVQSSCVSSSRKWVIGTDKQLGPVKDKNTSNRLGDSCYEAAGTRRSCYSVIGEGSIDSRLMYYHYKDCVCQ